MSVVIVRKLQRDEWPIVKAIAEECLGKGYLSWGGYHDQFLAVLRDDKIVGFCSYDFYADEEVTGFLLGGEAKQTEDAYIDTVAVLPEYRRCNYGTLLVGAAVGHLIQLGAHAVRVMAWWPKGKAHSNLGKCLERNGFEKIGELHNAYARGSDFAWNCTVCGPNTCECSAEVYRRALDSSFEA